MGNGFRLGRVAGIDVLLDWSLLIIFALVSVTLGTAVFPAWHPDWGAGLTWLVAVVAAVLLIASVFLHELSHALVGRAQGIDIKRITLFVFGGMAHLEREPHAWRPELLMAIVGPITSFVIGITCLWLAGALTGPLAIDPADPLAAMANLGPLATILFWLGPVNIVLALFNLVPGFPLDGGRVVRALAWGLTGDLVRATRFAAALGRLFGWVLIASGFAMILGVQVPIFGTGVVGGLWIALIGWFLNNAALASVRQVEVQTALDRVPVARVMISRFATVTPDTPVVQLIDDHLLTGDQRTFPVVSGGRLAGLVTFEDVRRVPVAERSRRTVSEIMTPAQGLPTVGPNDPAVAALRHLQRGGVSQLPVVENGQVRGLLRLEDVLEWLALQRDRAEQFG